MWNCYSSSKNSFGEWYIDNGFLKHMTHNKSSFVNIEKDKGSVSFGNNNSAKVQEKGTVNLGSKKPLAENVLLVDNMKLTLQQLKGSSGSSKELWILDFGIQKEMI